MLPAKVRDAVRGLLVLRVNRIVRLLRNPAAPDNAIANEAKLIGDAGKMLDPEFLASWWIDDWQREARRYARVCVWDGECEADATTDDGLCLEHGLEQAREQVEIEAQVARGEIAREDAG